MRALAVHSDALRDRKHGNIITSAYSLDTIALLSLFGRKLIKIPAAFCWESSNIYINGDSDFYLWPSVLNIIAPGPSPIVMDICIEEK